MTRGVSDSDSDYDERPSSSRVRLFGRQRHLHAILGGGRVADVLLWRNRSVSAAILFGISLIWFLFEVVEYQFLTLVCHLSITIMLIVFIWSNVALLFDRTPPRIPEIILSESAFKRAASTFHSKLNLLFITIYDIACGKDLKFFLLAVISLWLLSIIGTYFSTLNLVYIVSICILTLPALYDRYDEDVDHLVAKSSRDAKKLYRKFDHKVLRKIPRGPVKQN